METINGESADHNRHDNDKRDPGSAETAEEFAFIHRNLRL
jgi:hypothetical protein